MPNSNTKHKDRLFKFIFGNPDHKEWTLSLYNAVNGSNYTNPEDIEFNTIDDVIYIGMKNDVSFIVADDINLYEHQSSYNPNMPIRFFLYAGQLYEKYISGSGKKFLRFSRKIQKLPKPKCVCFYNGEEDQPEEQILKLSDAFGSVGDIEVRVRMLNINYGHSRALMEASSPLLEYAWFINAVRRYQKITDSLDKAMDTALDDMPDKFRLKKFLLAHKAEVKGMYLTEFNEENELKLLREEERAGGRAEGRAETLERVAGDMLRKNLPLGLIEEISRLSGDAIRALADKLGITVQTQ